MATTATTDFGAALSAAIHGGYVAHLTGQTYTITSPIVVHVTGTIQGALGIDGGGATLVSQVTDGSPLMQIVVGPGVDFRYLTLSNFTIQGNGREGDGIQLLADGNDRWAYNWAIDNVDVAGVGGYGLDMQGSVFEGVVVDSWMEGNALGGAYFSHSSNDGVASALRWLGGGFRDNGGAGLILDKGARDMGVDGATFTGNAGPGISALSGITSVTASTFEDNSGSGIAFQNYGNFDGNIFSSSGVQAIGIQGYLAGQAVLTGNTGVHTGPGPDATTLADLQGDGGLFVEGNTGRVVSGPRLAANAMGGDLTRVSIATAGVAMPMLTAVTAATTAAVADSTGTGSLETALRSALESGTVAHLADGIYTVGTPIVVNVTRSTAGPVGIDLGGAKIISQIGDGGAVIEIVVGPGVTLGSLTLSNFSILGNGGEGDGIKIVADGADRSARDWTIRNVNVEHVGGIGLDVLGNVSQGVVFNSWMHGNDQGGARFAGSAGGGVPGALEWMGGGVRKNGVAGLILDNGASDMGVNGAYFVDNDGPGLIATSGIASVHASGFENNLGAGAIVQNSSSFTADTFATYGRQTTGIGGYLAGGRVVLTGVGSEYYGADSDPTALANMQGQGTLAVAGGGNVVAGPNIAVTGALTTVVEADGSTSLVQAGAGYVLSRVGESSGPALKLSGAAVAPGQLGGWLPIAAEPAGSGYQVAWKLTGADQYAIWNVDGGGNYLSTAVNPVAGTTSLLRSFESVFRQDLDGDGWITSAALIDMSGATRLVEAAGNYFLGAVDGFSGPPLSYASALVAAGQFGGWSPIAAERFGSIYQVVWRMGADQFAVWNVDENGNYVSGASGTVQSFEFGFQQDLDADGTVGPPATIVEALGGTSLVRIGETYSLHPVGGSAGPQLKISGLPVAQGQMGAWMPIGAEQIGGLYQVVWKLASADQYAIWTVDGGGNYLTAVAGADSGTAALLQLFESSFHQDLNGSGAITPKATIEASGATQLVEAAGNYLVGPVDGSTGASLKLSGAPVAPGQLGAWSPIATEQVGSGYQVVWKLAGVDQYAIWTTDGAGNYLSSPAGALAAASPLMQSLESVFHQDLGHDGAPPAPTAALVDDTGLSSVDGITAGTALAGTADPGATVHVTVDGGAVAAAVRADDGGAWSYLPPGLTDGRHTVQVGEADASGHAGTASLSFVLDTRAPAAAFTGGTQVGDNVTLSGHAGEGGARIALFDGDLSLGTVIAGSDGRWSFGAAAASAVTHDYRATAVDVAGNEAATGSRLILGSVGNDDLAGGAGNDTIAAAGGDDRIAGGAGADRLTGGSGNDTFVFAVVADSPRGAPDVIADFRHDADKIDFTGLTAALHFQGDISGLGNLTLGARSIAFLEVAGSTQVLINVTDNAAIVTAADFHAADLEIVLTGVHLGLAASDFLVG